MLRSIRLILQFALLGTVIFGSIFGFHFKGSELEAFRILGAISFIFLGLLFFRSIIFKDFLNNKKN